MLGLFVIIAHLTNSEIDTGSERLPKPKAKNIYNFLLLLTKKETEIWRVIHVYSVWNNKIHNELFGSNPTALKQWKKDTKFRMNKLKLAI